MKIAEIINPLTEARHRRRIYENTQSINLLPVLLLLQGLGDNKGVPMELDIDALVNLVQNEGDTGFTAKSLNAILAGTDTSPKGQNLSIAVKELIRTEGDKVIFHSETEAEDSEDLGDNPDQYAQAPEDVVDDMAKKALKKRT